MKIIVNGQTKDFSSAKNLKTLIEEFCANPHQVIVELNGQVIKNDRWANQVIKENDSLELVTIVGGG